MQTSTISISRLLCHSQNAKSVQELSFRSLKLEVSIPWNSILNVWFFLQNRCLQNSFEQRLLHSSWYSAKIAIVQSNQMPGQEDLLRKSITNDIETRHRNDIETLPKGANQYRFDTISTLFSLEYSTGVKSGLSGALSGRLAISCLRGVTGEERCEEVRASASLVLAAKRISVETPDYVSIRSFILEFDKGRIPAFSSRGAPCVYGGFH